MQFYGWKSLTSAALLVGLCSGCSTFNQATVRSQSPEAQLMIHEQSAQAPGGDIQQVRGFNPVDPTFEGELKGAVQNHLYDETVTHHRYRTGPGIEGAYAGGPMPGAAYGPGQSPYRRYGNFDQQPCPTGPYAGFSNCPPQYQEQCWDHGGRRHRGIYNYHTYSYHEPKGLVYPAPNQPGGVVTYPYYTHKGPSDFFWKGDTVDY